jgi:hypothetical protein
MTPANFERALRAFVQRTPFQPFRVELLSGDAFAVIHPEALSLRGETAMFTWPDGRHKLFDSHSVCQIFDPANGAA